MMSSNRLPTMPSLNKSLPGRLAPRTGRRAASVRGAATISKQERIPGKQLKDPVRLQGTHTYKLRLKPGADPSCSLTAYMKTLGQDLSILKMPLGASLAKLTNKTYQVVAPRIQLWDIWLQPSSLSVVDFGDGFIGLESKQCDLKGSQHIPNLNEVFNLLVSMRFMYQDGLEPCVTSTATIAVDLDVPPPFNITPKPILEATGNAAFEATLKIMLDGYMRNLQEDYERWRADPQLRAARAEAATNAAV
mmetsp:Transcript_3091/g.7107  ORF Transcript_3091/g.7107 Transcript_3091/m.7107 type:complete len:248 (+) Transcript_3091:138-881(+)